jgi:hypothetical protein
MKQASITEKIILMGTVKLVNVSMHSKKANALNEPVGLQL